MKKSIRKFFPIFTLGILLTGCDSNIVVKESNKPNNTEESQKVSLDKTKFPTFFSNSEESSENKASSEEKKAESTNKSESDIAEQFKDYPWSKSWIIENLEEK